MGGLHEGDAKYYLLILSFVLAAIFMTFNVAYAADTDGLLSPFEKKLFRFINQYRVKKGLNPLSTDETLQRLAKTHSLDMNRKDSLCHDLFEERFKKSGRSHCVENVGWNYPTPEAQFQVWKNSRGHNVNLLSRKIKYAGISAVGAYATFFACD
jgi:uncharacterized protein YkwD